MLYVKLDVATIQAKLALHIKCVVIDAVHWIWTTKVLPCRTLAISSQKPNAFNVNTNSTNCFVPCGHTNRVPVDVFLSPQWDSNDVRLFCSWSWVYTLTHYVLIFLHNFQGFTISNLWKPSPLTRKQPPIIYHYILFILEPAQLGNT